VDNVRTKVVTMWVATAGSWKEGKEEGNYLEVIGGR